MLPFLRRAAAGCYDFVVGDDWRLFAAAVAALVLTAVAVLAGLPAWPVAPVIVILVILWSTLRPRTPN